MWAVRESKRGYLRILVPLALLVWLVGCQSRTLTPPLPAPKGEGWEVGNGGNSIELEFKDTSRRAIREITVKSPKEAKRLQAPRLRAAIERARIVSTRERLYKDGKPVDALNFPSEGKVVINEERWGTLSAQECEHLAIHELYGLIGVDDSNYETTNDFVSWLDHSHLVLFHMLQFGGPAAASAIKHFDWRGQIVASWGTIGTAENSYELQFDSHDAADDSRTFLICDFSGPPVGLDNPFRGLSKDFYPVESSCQLWARGTLEGGSVAHLVIDRSNLELWRRLGGSDSAGFNHPSLQGSIDSAGVKTIRLEIDPSPER